MFPSSMIRRCCIFSILVTGDFLIPDAVVGGVGRIKVCRMSAAMDHDILHIFFLSQKENISERHQATASVRGNMLSLPYPLETDAMVSCFRRVYQKPRTVRDRRTKMKKNVGTEKSVRSFIALLMACILLQGSADQVWAAATQSSAPGGITMTSSQSDTAVLTCPRAVSSRTVSVLDKTEKISGRILLPKGSLQGSIREQSAQE